MTGQNDNAISIKLEIRIPTNGAPPAVVVEKDAFSRPPAATFEAVQLSIDVPNSSPVATTFTGKICASGTAFGANTVYAKVFSGTITDPFSASMSGAISTTPTPEGDWSFSEVGTVANYPSTTTHTLVVWAREGSVITAAQTVVFTPAWGSSTECNGGNLSFAENRLASPPDLAFETIPSAWELKAGSFGGALLGSLNGSWTLKLQTSPNEKVAYCNGGNGSTSPRIQLTCDSPFGKSWQLRFELGESRITYSLCASKFNGLGQNVFRDVASAGVPDDAAIPASITIQPR